MSLTSRLGSALRSAARSRAVRRGVRQLGRAAVRAATGARRPTDAAQGVRSALADRSPAAPLTLTYAPRDDGRPDPGEIVWGWVPFEEDLTRGKDRPVLVIAQEDASAGGTDGTGPVLIALMLTSHDHAEAGGIVTDEHGATWVDIGAGDWDRQGRPSEVRADRLLRLAPSALRREGGRLDRSRYDRVAAAVRSVHGWS